MKLATLKEGGRDGTLIVVRDDLTIAVRVPSVAPTLQAALDDWGRCEALLEAVAEQLNGGKVNDTFPFDAALVHSPLPRAYLWCEASVWISHLERARRASNRELQESFYAEPAMHEGGSDVIVGPWDPMHARQDDWDLDLEAGICVIVDDVEMGVSEEDAARHIKLVLLVNDFSLRAIQYPEMAKGLGCLQSKPANAFSPVAVTPKGLGAAWLGNMLAARVHVTVNGMLIGRPEGDKDALFSFPRLISHLARTRHIAAGAIIGAGTVSNRDESAGVACLSEKRALEILNDGNARTPWLKFGDEVGIEALDSDGQSIFGKISQKVMLYSPRVDDCHVEPKAGSGHG